MLNSESVSLQPRPNLVYVEGGVGALRLAPDQAKSLGLREGQVINALVANRPDGSVLMLGAKSLSLPPGFASGQASVSLLVSVVGGQMVLSLIDKSSATGKQRVQSGPEQRFKRLLSQVGSFHLSRLLEPNSLAKLLGQFIGTDEGDSLNQLLLSGSRLSGDQIRQRVEGSGLFAESQIKNGLAVSGASLKSILLTIQRLFRSRHLETSNLSGAIEELEARQLESLSAQLGNRGASMSWVLPFIDQRPVFLSLGRGEEDKSDGDGSREQSTWFVDLDIPLTEKESCGVNLELGRSMSIKVTGWIPHPLMYKLAVEHKETLLERMAEAGLTVDSVKFYSVGRKQPSNSVPPDFKGLEVSA